MQTDGSSGRFAQSRRPGFRAFSCGTDMLYVLEMDRHVSFGPISCDCPMHLAYAT